MTLTKTIEWKCPIEDCGKEIIALDTPGGRKQMENNISIHNLKHQDPVKWKTLPDNTIIEDTD